MLTTIRGTPGRVVVQLGQEVFAVKVTTTASGRQENRTGA